MNVYTKLAIERTRVWFLDLDNAVLNLAKSSLGVRDSSHSMTELPTMVDI